MLSLLRTATGTRSCTLIPQLGSHFRFLSSKQSFSPQLHSEDERKEIAAIYNSLKQYRSGSVDLDFSQNDRVAVLTLNYPEKHNPLSGGMMCDLLDAVVKLEAADDRCTGLIVRGYGGTFCSGGDLTFVRQIMNSKDGYRMCRFMQHTLQRLSALPQVSVALLEGAALGGGAELATWTDWRIADPDAKIGFVQSRMGVITGFGGTTRLVSLLGASKALQILVRGETFKAAEAHRIGLVDLIVPQDAANSNDKLKRARSNELFALDWLSNLCSFGEPQVIRAFKRSVVVAAGSDPGNSLANERKEFSLVWGAAAHAAAVNKQQRKKS